MGWPFNLLTSLASFIGGGTIVALISVFLALWKKRARSEEGEKGGSSSPLVGIQFQFTAELIGLIGLLLLSSLIIVKSLYWYTIGITFYILILLFIPFTFRILCNYNTKNRHTPKHN